MPLSLHDNNLLQYQASRDFYRHTDCLEGIRAHWPSLGETPLCIELNHLSVPSQLLVQPICDFTWQSENEVAQRDMLLRTAKQTYEHSGKRYLLCVKYRNGDAVRKYPQL